MVKKARPADATPVAPARRPRSSSWISAKTGSRAQQPQQTLVQVPAPPPGSAAWLTTPGTYTTNSRRRKKAGRRGAEVAVLPPQLPQLGTAATAVPGLVPQPGMLPVLAPAAEPVKRPGEDTWAAMDALQRWAWRNRWQLAPFAASTATVAGAATTPVLTLLGLAAVAGSGYVLAEKGPDEIAGRVWLSRAERRLVGRWAAGAWVWSSGVWIANAAGLDWKFGSVAVAAAALGLFTGEQVFGWLKSRRIRPAKADEAQQLSEKAAQLLAAWPYAVFNGPDKLAGSTIIDIEEPDEGTIVLTVQLRADVHASTVANKDTEHWLERALHMGVGTARAKTVRDDAGHLRITLTPSRQLEKVTKIWPGPVLHENGRVPVAVTTDNREVCLRVFNDSGVYHHLLLGSSGAGKSNTLNVMLLPTILKRLSVAVYLDGKKGTSSPRLARAMDTAIRNPKMYGPAIEMVHRIMTARQIRYGELGIDDFNAATSKDPIIELIIDECTSVLRHLTDQHEDMLAEMSETGRALGIALKYSSQRGNADDLPGGMQVRNNMMGSVGNVVALRPGGNHAQNTTLTATSEEIDLLSLPGGDNAGGWCAVMLAGQVVGFPARIMFDPKKDSRVDSLLDGFKPRTLEGPDREAAGEFYASRPTGAQWYADQLAARARQESGEAVMLPVPATAPAPAAAVPTGPQDVPATQTTDKDDDVFPGAELDQITERLNAEMDKFGRGGRVVEIGQRQRVKGGRNLQSVLEGLHAAGPEGTTAADLAAAVGLGLSTVNAHVSRLVTDGKAAREGVLIRARLEEDEPES
jgi:hypothetical protein